MKQKGYAAASFLKEAFITCAVLLLLFACRPNLESSRITEDFNFDWKFKLGLAENAMSATYPDQDWRAVRLPHDWSIEQGYTTENTACSTGFLPAGIGWYRKTFYVPKEYRGQSIRIDFDGVCNNSEVYLNGQLLGKRPSGYSAFSYDLTDKLFFGDEKNVIAVKVDHSRYADSRWYTGSGINRNVKLVILPPIHFSKWGVKITTPEVSHKKAVVQIETSIDNDTETSRKLQLQIDLLDAFGEVVATSQSPVEVQTGAQLLSVVELANPRLWDVENPNLYTARLMLKDRGAVLDETDVRLGIRSASFDANCGFLLNGKQVKIKGVNMHDDAGLLGTAVPKDVWRSRVLKLKSIGCNAIRMSHNAHSTDLMDVCDEMGMLVMAEAFDEWMVPKDKSIVYLGDGAAPDSISRGYSSVFNEWAERDIKDLVHRDFNHPSVILWSIGNEIEWTFPYYSATYNDVNGKQVYNTFTPNYDSLVIRTAFNKRVGVADSLTITAQKLAGWVKEIDTTRAVTTGSVHPSIALASGYGQAVDVLGFNYRAVEYDRAHQNYPNLKIIGSENWGSWMEWKNVNERDFVAGMFAWTGFAYIGEAGPWPRKGLEISFFDFAGFKTPRGHFFECLWTNTPKIYMVTTPANLSEYSIEPNGEWKFTKRKYEIPSMSWLRNWEWDVVSEKWNYRENDPIVVQAYTNCDEAELFLNGESLGKKALADCEDGILKWFVKYKTGALKIIGYNDGVFADEYELKSQEPLKSIEIDADKSELHANNYDVVQIELKLLDESGTLVTDSDQEVIFEYQGDVTLLGVDNGWEMNVQDHKTNRIVTHNGKALIMFQTTSKADILKLTARSGDLKSNELTIQIQ